VNLLLTNLRKLCDSLEVSHGKLALAGLFKPEAGREQWAFVVAATWLSGRLSDYELLARELKRHLSSDELACVSRTVILPSARNGTGAQFEGGIGVPSTPGVMRDFTLNGEPIAEAHIIVSSAAARRSSGASRAQGKRRRTATAARRTPPGRLRAGETMRHHTKG